MTRRQSSATSRRGEIRPMSHQVIRNTMPDTRDLIAKPEVPSEPGTC
jgi:hypothetical protein